MSKTTQLLLVGIALATTSVAYAESNEKHPASDSLTTISTSISNSSQLDSEKYFSQLSLPKKQEYKFAKGFVYKDNSHPGLLNQDTKCEPEYNGIFTISHNESGKPLKNNIPNFFQQKNKE